MKIKMSLRTKMMIMIISATLIAAISSVYISYKTYSDIVDTYYKNTITNIADTAASMMDAGIIGDYVEEREPDAQYDEMMSVLKKIKNNSDIKYLYIQVIRGESAIALMDTDEEDPMGFREEFPVSKGADISALEEGIPAFISNEEGVGWMCSVFRPIKNAQGKTVALVGADMSMDDVMRERHAFLNRVLAVIMLVTILAAVGMVLYTRRIVISPIKQLSEATKNFVSYKQQNDMITREGGTDNKDSGINDTGENDTGYADRTDNTIMEEENRFGSIPPMGESMIARLEIVSKDEIGELTHSIKVMEEEIYRYIDDLTSITAEKERIGAELNVATQIQANMLPGIFPAFPNHTEFDIYASMNPAKEVGGDFYDFFLADEEHLVLVMADVSGKGVPAALFMVIAKILLKNCAQNHHSPKEVLEIVNNQLCENNEADMFVTVWLGILEIATGKMVAANAGHEYPVIKRAGKDYELIKDRHGFVLAGMEDSRYTEYELTISKGDRLFLYTDGVPEATNAEHELFGNERMLEALNRYKDCPVNELLVKVKEEIDTFVGEAPQFDDITMLGFDYKGWE